MQFRMAKPPWSELAWLAAALLALLPIHVSLATKSCWNKQPKLLPAPSEGEHHGDWLASLWNWRRDQTATGYDGRIYSQPSLAWTRTSYIQPQIHVYDRFLYDGTWTVDRYLNDLVERYGGIDSVLLWPTYANIGIDDRNQFDYYRAVPGGLPALSTVTAAFHRRGVRVLWGYNPWDQATRDEGPHWDVLARLLKDTGGDGFNGDTMPDIPEQFWQAGLNQSYLIVTEPEGGGYPCTNASWEKASWTPLGWGYFGKPTPDNMTQEYDFAPGVDKMKWLDPKGRHLTHVCDRWAKNRTAAIQLAFFNGEGYEPWENIWGIYNKVTDRDAELLRRSASILRWAGQRNFTHDFDAWIPHAPEATDSSVGIFASRFEKGGNALWLLVNKFGGSSREIKFQVPDSFIHGKHSFFDVYHGLQLNVDASGRLLHSLDALGVGAVLATTDTGGVFELLWRMHVMSSKPLSSFSGLWHYLPQSMDHMISSSGTFDKAHPPPDMVLLPQARLNFTVSGVELEGGCNPTKDPHGVCCQYNTLCDSAAGSNTCQCGILGSQYFGVGVQYPWESRPERSHAQILDLGPVLIDRDLVTNDDFRRYLAASGYKPTDDHNFLRHWQAGHPRKGDELKPVVNVGLEEARAYCTFQGKRLPHSYEWQYAAQGLDGRLYPWGADWDPEAVPTPGHDPAEVGKHPRGNSPFGVRDMVGNVWQYTDSFSDSHTRSVLLRGSSRYRPRVSNEFPAVSQYSNWYFPPALELTKHGRYFLMSNSYERAGTLGFRCAADVAGGAPGPHHYRTSEHQPVYM